MESSHSRETKPGQCQLNSTRARIKQLLTLPYVLYCEIFDLSMVWRGSSQYHLIRFFIWMLFNGPSTHVNDWFVWTVVVFGFLTWRSNDQTL